MRFAGLNQFLHIDTRRRPLVQTAELENLKLEFVIRSPTTIPFIEKQTMKIGQMNVYRPYNNDGVLAASYFRDPF